MLGESRAQGNTSSIYFSNLSVLLGAFALWGLVIVERWWRWLFVAAFGCAIGAAVLGGTRGSVITVAAVILVFGAYFFGYWRRSLRFKLAAIVGGIAVITLFVHMFFDVTRIATIAGTASEMAFGGVSSDVSANIRLMLYNAALHSFADSPIFGHGWWQRFAAAMPYMADVEPEKAFDLTQHLHNDTLNFASAAGILGIVAYFLLLAAPVVSAVASQRTDDRALRIAIAASLSAGYLAMGLTDTMFVFETPKSIYVLSAAIVMAFFLDAPQAAKSI